MRAPQRSVTSVASPKSPDCQQLGQQGVRHQATVDRDDLVATVPAIARPSPVGREASVVR